MKTKQLTVRGVSTQLGRRLEEMSRARGQSVNATVLELLEQAAGIEGRKEWLRRFMTWTPEDVREAGEIVRQQRVVDAKAWD